MLIIFFGVSTAVSAESPKHRKLSAVPFTAIEFQDGFLAARLETNRRRSLPHNLRMLRETGRIDNFLKAAGKMKGEYEGYYFNDSDVYKVVEAAAYVLALNPDPKLEKDVDEIIAAIAAAQWPDGYLNTYFTLTAPKKRWTDMHVKHELYCAGHLIEAAAAHFNATGKRTLLDVAEKFAAHIDGKFGPSKLREPPGHEEIELALVKLHRLTGEEKYLRLAEFFIDLRGDRSRPKTWGAEYQDHLPVRRQEKIAGHAVRAMYLCCGATDVAAHSGDPALIRAMRRLWSNMVERKMYVTGGVGARPDREEFGGDFQLPNDTAYCETCAAVGVVFWAHRMNLMHADARFADVLERALYNGVLSGTSLDGERFFYVNPLASDGTHHRRPFFKCACCPPNLVRLLASLAGYVYAVGDRRGTGEIYVNLYAAGEAAVPFGDNVVRLRQRTRYPWDGQVRLSVNPRSSARFALCLRIPRWGRGAELTVNGKPVAPLEVEKGYARLTRLWRSGDTVRLNLPMPVERIEANPRVAADRGRVAVRRGPIVYCFEAIDNGGSAMDVVLPLDPKFTAEYHPDLLGGVTVVSGVDRRGRKITAVPYHAWDNRRAGEMIVWVRQEGKSRNPPADDPTWRGKLYRPLDPAAR